MLKDADLDGNGSIDFDEFVALFSKERIGSGLGGLLLRGMAFV